jgi:hypothetical protein
MDIQTLQIIKRCIEAHRQNHNPQTSSYLVQLSATSPSLNFCTYQSIPHLFFAHATNSVTFVFLVFEGEGATYELINTVAKVLILPIQEIMVGEYFSPWSPFISRPRPYELAQRSHLESAGESAPYTYPRHQS